MHQLQADAVLLEELAHQLAELDVVVDQQDRGVVRRDLPRRAVGSCTIDSRSQAMADSVIGADAASNRVSARGRRRPAIVSVYVKPQRPWERRRAGRVNEATSKGPPSERTPVGSAVQVRVDRGPDFVVAPAIRRSADTPGRRDRPRRSDARARARRPGPEPDMPAGVRRRTSPRACRRPGQPSIPPR